MLLALSGCSRYPGIPPTDTAEEPKPSRVVPSALPRVSSSGADAARGSRGRPILQAVSLSKQILVALVAGVAIGLFFGERVAFLVLGWWED